MSTSKLTRLLFGVATATLLAHLSCSLSAGRCIQMSDCDDGTVCIEGTCKGGFADDSISSTTSPGVKGDPSDARVDPPRVEAGVDAASAGDGQAVDDGGDDGAVTEPTSDL